MDSAPPLNLSTSVKVKDSLSTPESNVSLPVKSELVQHPDSNQFVLLEHMPNEVEGVVITGEINENSQTEKTPALTKKDEATNENESSESYVCSHCSEKFLRANQLRSHEKTHVEEKVFISFFSFKKYLKTTKCSVSVCLLFLIVLVIDAYQLSHIQY